MEVNGPKIREFRLALGLSKEDLAKRVQPRPVTRQTIENWERGMVRTFRVLNMVAGALGIRPEALLKKPE
jgi:transcriptional regulator with XRE-family HTH domain